MKYTDGMFKFPIKIYDSASMSENEKQLEILGREPEGETKWTKGTARVPLNEIQGIFDYFSRSQTIEEVEDNGFSSSYIITKTLGHFICTWDSQKFEDEINKFADEYTNKVEKMVEEETRKKVMENLASQPFVYIEPHSEVGKKGGNWFTRLFKK